jgi:cyclophilin family peptidyl-prolyl cis-trans isomerase
MAPKKHKKHIPQKRQKLNSNRTTWIAIGAIAIVLVIFGVLAASGILGNRSDTTPEPLGPTKVLLETSVGNITIDLRTDKPITSGNFIKLVNEGKYDGATFYRTISDFMIQGGRADGSVPSIKDEIGTSNRNTNYTIAMAKTDQPNSATSEFFINTVDNSGTNRYAGFDTTYTVFGTVIEGQDVVDAIANAPVTENPNIPGEMSKPVNPVTILRATIIS